MTTSSFSAGAVVEFQGRTYELLRKLADDVWQLRDVRNERISEFEEGQLRVLYVDGELRFNAERLSKQVAAAVGSTDMSSEEWEVAKVRLLYVRACGASIRVTTRDNQDDKIFGGVILGLLARI
jgi:hypothetical protein